MVFIGERPVDDREKDILLGESETWPY